MKNYTWEDILERVVKGQDAITKLECITDLIEHSKFTQEALDSICVILNAKLGRSLQNEPE